MNGLNISTFVTPDRDWEKNQYKILAGLKEYQLELNKKRICPSLTELVNLSALLDEILKQKKSLHAYFPKQVMSFDIQQKSAVYDTIENINEDLEFYFELIEWALPKVKEIIDEGIILYEFVENNLKLDSVGILPLYKDEGYFLIANPAEQDVQIHKYECSLFHSNQEKYRSLKTNLLKTVPLNRFDKSPEAIKLELINEYKELPNPATFYCETELDFPFAESLFPIAKRKLITQLAA